MFIRTFTLISILFILGACQDAPVTGDAAAKTQSPNKEGKSPASFRTRISCLGKTNKRLRLI